MREVDQHLLVRVLAEGPTGIRHLLWPGQEDGGAVVRRAVAEQGLERLETHAAGVEGVVIRDLGALVVEEDAAVGLEEGERDLGVPFVGAVADAQEAAATLAVVEKVEVHALVEVLLGAERMGVVVFRPDVAEYLFSDH